MWNISSQSFGFVLTFSGKPTAAELREWVAESRRHLAGPLPQTWGVVVDLRALQPLDADAQAVMAEGQGEYKRRGNARVAVVLVDAVATMQFRRLGRSNGIDGIERFINAETTPNWQVAAKRWVADGIEPPR